MRTEEEIIPRLILSIPFTSQSPYSIVEIAKDIEDLKNMKGSLSKISDFIGVSEGMLNQFIRVNKIVPKGKELVSKRIIDSVSLVNNLAKFSENDQNYLITEFIDNKITSSDIKLLSPLRRQFPNESISNLIEKLKKSENQKVSIINFDINELKKSIPTLKIEIEKIIDSSELIDLSSTNQIGTIKITPKGEKILRKVAKQNHKSLQNYIYLLLK